MSPNPQLNEKIVAALPAPAKGNKVHYFSGAVLGGVTAPDGFGVCVTSAGNKSFVLGYRHKRAKRRYTIGKSPTRCLRSKRPRNCAAGSTRAKTHWPPGDKTEAENTFKATCNKWFKREGDALRTAEERKRDLQRLAYPVLGNKPIESIKRSDINRLVDDVADACGPVMADRLLAYISRVMSWHAVKSDDFVSPIVRGMARTSQKERARTRILSDDELRAVWKVAEASPAPFGKLVQFILLTAAWRAEASEMENNGPVAGFSEHRKAFYLASGTSGWTIHDLRRTAKSLVSRAQVRPDWCEHCLGHTLPGIQGVYNVWACLPEKRQAYEALAALVGRILDPQDNVVLLQRATA